MPSAKHYMPEGYRSVTPHLVVKNGLEAIRFYERAFGAELKTHAPGPTPGSTMHAELVIGDSFVFLMDSPAPELAPRSPPPPAIVLHMWVPDVDATFARAIAAGATEVMAPADQFWGDRYGQVRDPHGLIWAIATQKEQLTMDEIQTRAKEFFAPMGGS
jgi:uncharacterized glyoxalase superfamily protein PhnB